MSATRAFVQHSVHRTPWRVLLCAPSETASEAMMGIRRSDSFKVRQFATSSEGWKIQSANEAEKFLEDGGFKGIAYSRFVTLGVRWGDLDAYGHVNNTVFFRFFEQARVDFLYGIGTSLGPETIEGGVVAETWCKFRAPLMYPDDVTIGIASSLAEDSDSTWLQRYAILSHKTGVVVAEGSAKMVWFDFQAGQRKAIPPKFVGYIRGQKHAT